MATNARIPKAALAFLLVLVLAGGACQGFFVDPALMSVTVTPPTPSIAEGMTLQMTATGTYEDGTTKTITASATWSTSDGTIATVNNTGVVAGVAPGSASISASSGAVSGSTNVTITLSGLVSIQVTPTNASISSAQTQQFKAMGKLQNGQQEDITTAVSWNSSRTNVATIDATGLATAETVNITSTMQITATSGNVVSNAANLTVTP
jgi:uncharacterized protein YjdB